MKVAGQGGHHFNPFRQFEFRDSALLQVLAHRCQRGCLLALLGLLLGLFAILVTPREEEPQIDVTLANVFVGFPGASTIEVENLVAIPMEQVLSEIGGVKHVYSMSRPGMSVLTVQFEVGEPRTEALVRLYNAIYSNQDWQPQGLGILPPLVKPKGIDDVPIVSVTLWTDDPERAGAELRKVAHALETELKRVPGTRDIYTVGGPEPVLHVLLDAQRLSGYGLALQDLRKALSQANQSSHAGELVADNRSVVVKAGELLGDACAPGGNGLEDVDHPKHGSEQSEQRSTAIILRVKAVFRTGQSTLHHEGACHANR